MSLQNVPVMVDHSMMEFPDMKAVSIQQQMSMKSGYNQTYVDTKETGMVANPETAESDCHAQELTAPYDAVK